MRGSAECPYSLLVTQHSALVRSGAKNERLRGVLVGGGRGVGAVSGGGGVGNVAAAEDGLCDGLPPEDDEHRAVPSVRVFQRAEREWAVPGAVPDAALRQREPC